MKIFLISIVFGTHFSAIGANFSCLAFTDPGQGQVYLETELTKESERFIFHAYIGREDYRDPFKVRSECRKIAQEFNSMNDHLRWKEQWVEFGCVPESRYTNLDRLQIEISLGNRLFTFSPVERYKGQDNGIYISGNGDLARCDPW